jgi:hypothetical protein
MNDTNATTQLGGFGDFGFGSADAPSDVIGNYCGEFIADFDTDGLTHAYVEAINTALNGTGISLHGREFYGPYPAYAAASLIREAVWGVDLDDLARQFDRSA